LAVFLRVQNLTAPCGEDHLGFGCNYFSNIGKYYSEDGFIKTKFGAVISKSEESNQYLYYVHHPAQLLYLLIGISFKLFGESPVSVRIIPLFFSIGNLILIFLFSKKIWNIKIAYIASFIFAVIPMASVYGPHVDNQGSLPTFFILLTFFFYTEWVKTDSRIFYWIMVAVFLIGTQTDWPIYLTVPAIMVHNIITTKTLKKEMLFFPLIAGIALTLYLVYVKFLTGSFIGTGSYKGSILGSYEVRVSDIASDFDHSLKFTLSEFVFKLWSYYDLMFTPTIMMLSVSWFIMFVLKLYQKNNIEKDMINLTLFLPGVIYILLFMQGAWIHDFWSVYLLPGLVISSALMVYEIAKKLPKYISVPLIVVLSVKFVLDSIMGFALRQYHAYGTHLGITEWIFGHIGCLY
jgi:4-amino-4-deoxy-L-arabinose transferase-like glycosyltransferase